MACGFVVYGKAMEMMLETPGKESSMFILLSQRKVQVSIANTFASLTTWQRIAKFKTKHKVKHTGKGEY